MSTTKSESVVISAPNFGIVELVIRGTAPLVIERFSKKAEMMMKMAEGPSAKNKKQREARDFERDAEEARYRSKDGWEGLNAAAIRNAMISACRLVGFKMTIAKLSCFVMDDGRDRQDGQPLVRIYGESRTFTAAVRNATGVADIRARPQYPEWAARLRIRFDQTQFKTQDVVNLVARVGMQVGIGAGRADSKTSAGCGWGMFEIVSSDDETKVRQEFGIA
jgi:hypothetical protein